MLGVLLTVIIAIVSVLLILIILVQNPKGGGLNSAFGGASAASQMLGAARSSDMVEKVTWGLASALLIFCLIAGLTFKGADGQNTSNPDKPTLELNQ